MLFISSIESWAGRCYRREFRWPFYLKTQTWKCEKKRKERHMGTSCSCQRQKDLHWNIPRVIQWSSKLTQGSIIRNFVHRQSCCISTPTLGIGVHQDRKIIPKIDKKQAIPENWHCRRTKWYSKSDSRVSSHIHIDTLAAKSSLILSYSMNEMKRNSGQKLHSSALRGKGVFLIFLVTDER